MDVLEYNKRAWDKQVAKENQWTLPVSSEAIAKARRGEWSVVLTPTLSVPQKWFPVLRHKRVLALAAGGGQQGPLLAAAGATVVVLDNSPAQLAQDQKVAERDALALTTAEGDMADLSRFPDESFDMIFNPCSNGFIPDVKPVWREAFRVLKQGGILMTGFANPVLYAVDPVLEAKGIVQLKYAIPYSDVTSLTKEEQVALLAKEEPLCFGHTLQDQIGGQLEAGFMLTAMFEDSWEEAKKSPLEKLLNVFMATRAVKPYKAR